MGLAFSDGFHFHGEASDRLREVGISETFGGVLWGWKPPDDWLFVKIGRMRRIDSHNYIPDIVCSDERNIPYIVYAI